MATVNDKGGLEERFNIAKTAMEEVLAKYQAAISLRHGNEFTASLGLDLVVKVRELNAATQDWVAEQERGTPRRESPKRGSRIFPNRAQMHA